MKALITIIIVGILAFTAYLFTGAPDTEKTSGDVAGNDTYANNAGTGGTSAAAAPENITSAIREEATAYIQEITQSEEQPVEANKANDFMSGDQKITLAEKQQVERIKPEELLTIPGIDENTPITVVTTQEQIEHVDVAKIVKDSGGQLDQKVHILDGDTIRETTVEQLATELDKDEKVAVIKKVEQFEIRTPAEILADTSIDKTSPLNIIKKPYRIETATVDELLMNDAETGSGNDVFYVRNVSNTDAQGIWGIVHNGLIENFATGIALRRGETIKKYRIKIPQDADEIQQDASSSYLGKLIQAKTSESFVYNFKQGKMGRNPDLIYPGQEIIIIRFSTDELISIYQHFVQHVNG